MRWDKIDRDPEICRLALHTFFVRYLQPQEKQAPGKSFWPLWDGEFKWPFSMAVSWPPTTVGDEVKGHGGWIT